MIISIPSKLNMTQKQIIFHDKNKDAGLKILFRLQFQEINFYPTSQNYNLNSGKLRYLPYSDSLIMEKNHRRKNYHEMGR